MPDKIGLIYSKDFKRYNFGETHPLRPIRVELTYALFEALGLTTHERLVVIPPEMATEEELTEVHSHEYVAAIKHYSETGPSAGISPEAFQYGLGPGDNPIFKGMHEASALVAGASLTAMKHIMDPANDLTMVFNPAGGLHHAVRDKASGFCIYNDIAVAIAHYLKYTKKRVMYIDIDAHHGDGVQWIFYNEPRVLTVSLHESGKYLFPGTGFVSEMGKGKGKGSAINLPMKPNAYEQPYLDVFDAIVPAAAEIYQPDLIVSQLGVDTHFNDPLTGLGLTTGTHERLGQRIRDIARENTGDNWLAVGGGGYLMTVVPRSWAMILAMLLDVTLPNELPEEWVSQAHKLVPEEPTPTRLRDFNGQLESRLMRDPVYAQDHMDYADNLVAQVKNEVFPELKKLVETLA